MVHELFHEQIQKHDAAHVDQIDDDGPERTAARDGDAGVGKEVS